MIWVQYDTDLRIKEKILKIKEWLRYANKRHLHYLFVAH